ASLCRRCTRLSAGQCCALVLECIPCLALLSALLLAVGNCPLLGLSLAWKIGDDRDHAILVARHRSPAVGPLLSRQDGPIGPGPILGMHEGRWTALRAASPNALRACGLGRHRTNGQQHHHQDDYVSFHFPPLVI